MKKFIRELNSELSGNILPYWINNMVDHNNGGFYGQIDGDDSLHRNANKGIILNTRILWTFSAAYLFEPKKVYKDMADRAYHYIIKYFLDEKEGGMFWLLDSQGNPIELKKQVYAQAFVIYSLSEYYKISQNKEILDHAISIYQYIERKAFDVDNNGYFEAYTRDWKLLDDLRLSDKDANEKKSMNTHLHLLEAYTNLYRVWDNAELMDKLNSLINVFTNKILDDSTYHFNLFFDEKWNIKSHTVSYGHDIEGSWLLLEAAQATGQPELIKEIERNAIKMADVTIAEGLDNDGAVIYEKHPGHFNFDKHWWPQAEAMVGFVNAYQLTDRSEYLDRAIDVWNFVKKSIIDKKYGEWYFRVNRDGAPYTEEDKAGIWKCPYHNSRACIEIINRLK